MLNLVPPNDVDPLQETTLEAYRDYNLPSVKRFALGQGTCEILPRGSTVPSEGNMAEGNQGRQLRVVARPYTCRRHKILLLLGQYNQGPHGPNLLQRTIHEAAFEPQ